MCRRGHVRATHHARHFFPTNRIHKYICICTIRQILVARTLLLVRRHREEQLLDAVIASEYGVLLKSCPPCFLSMIGGTHPAQGVKQIPLIRQVYAEAQRQLPIGDPARDRC